MLFQSYYKIKVKNQNVLHNISCYSLKKHCGANLHNIRGSKFSIFINVCIFVSEQHVVKRSQIYNSYTKRMDVDLERIIFFCDRSKRSQTAQSVFLDDMWLNVDKPSQPPISKSQTDYKTESTIKVRQTMINNLFFIKFM